jgi:hypothetical protein
MTINILTRTSGRPHYFHVNIESVKEQDYPHINHIVICDDKESLVYVSEYDGIDVLDVSEIDFYSKPDIQDPRTGNRFIYNLYLNEALDRLQDGLVLVLDDDDHFIHNNVCSKVAAAYQKKTGMVVSQMRYSDGSLLPHKNELTSKCHITRIGSPCFWVDVDIAKKFKFDGWKCADHRFYSRCWDESDYHFFVPEPLVQIGSQAGNLGKRNDKRPI